MNDVYDKSILNVSCQYTMTSIESNVSNITDLYCYNTYITSLPPLPNTLRCLLCCNSPIIALPILPSNLRWLNCAYTNITSLPDILPLNLETLAISHTQLQKLPPLPLSLRHLSCEGTLFPQQSSNESMQTYIQRMREWVEEEESKERCQLRCKNLKQTLIRSVYHPKNVGRILKMYDWKGLDYLNF